MSKAYIVARVDDNGIVIIHPMDDSPIWETIHPITGERNRVDIAEGHVVDVSVVGIAVPPKEKEEPMTDLDLVYRERNRLVAYLASLYPARIVRGEDPDWPLIIIQTPEGQMSWHVPKVEVRSLFPHLHESENWTWDGHTTEEKYERLARLTKRGCL